MAEYAYLTPSVVDQYLARFPEGDFDRGLFSEMATQSLMAEALRRDSPVTQEDLEAMHQTLYRQPMPGPGLTSEPSGYAPAAPVPAPEAALPAAWTALPPEAPPAEEPARASRTAEEPSRASRTPDEDPPDKTPEPPDERSYGVRRR